MDPPASQPVASQAGRQAGRQAPSCQASLAQGGGAVSVSQTHRIFKFSILCFFDFPIWDLSQTVSIYIVRSDEADGGVHVT